MLRRELIPVWVGIAMMASFFLMGQSWDNTTGGCLHVIDANGQDIGILTSYLLYTNYDGFGVLDTSLDAIYRVNPLGETKVGSAVQYFESNDCTGQVYLLGEDKPPIAQVVYMGSDSKLYKAPSVSTPIIQSSLLWDGCDTDYLPPPGAILGVAEEFTAPLPGPFTPPLRLEVR